MSAGGFCFFFLILHRTIFFYSYGQGIWTFMLVSILLFIAAIAEHSNSNGKTSCKLHRSQEATPSFKRDIVHLYFMMMHSAHSYSSSALPPRAKSRRKPHLH